VHSASSRGRYVRSRLSRVTPGASAASTASGHCPLRAAVRTSASRISIRPGSRS
jgi:hypothetical protein